MKNQVEIPQAQSWRDITQGVSSRVMSAPGRRRRGMNIARAVLSFLILGGLAALVAYLVQGFDRPAETLAPVVRAEPLREIVVLTDGVLDDAWASRMLNLPEGIGLMAVDLDAACATLLRAGQVRTAVVARDFPDTLVITLEERLPVVRIMAALEPGKHEPLVVARDGVVYRPVNNNAAMLAALPWLDGVRLTRAGDEFAPLVGIDTVADLLLTAQQEAPHLVGTWKVVSLEEAPRLVVRTRDIRQIVFDSVNVRRQLAWLDHILEREAAAPEPRAIERIDLSIAARSQPPAVPQVAVRYVQVEKPQPRGARLPTGQAAGRLLRAPAPTAFRNTGTGL